MYIVIVCIHFELFLSSLRTPLTTFRCKSTEDITTEK